MRRIECFQKKYNCINYCPSFFILFMSISIFSGIQYILTNYIINSAQSLSIFILGNVIIYFTYYLFDYVLSIFSTSYNKIKDKNQKYYVLSNLIKSGLLFVYTPNAINILHQTMYLNNWNNLQIKNMGSLYAIPDCVSLFMVKNMHKSTFIHHTIVILFYVFNLMNDYKKENIFRTRIIYAIFSTFTYAVNFILGIRFYENKKIKKIIIPFVFYFYMLCCSINWTWNMYYIHKLIINNNNIYIYLYIGFISLIIWDDIVLMKWLRYKSS